MISPQQSPTALPLVSLGLSILALLVSQLHFQPVEFGESGFAHIGMMEAELMVLVGLLATLSFRAAEQRSWPRAVSVLWLLATVALAMAVWHSPLPRVSALQGVRFFGYGLLMLLACASFGEQRRWHILTGCFLSISALNAVVALTQLFGWVPTIFGDRPAGWLTNRNMLGAQMCCALIVSVSCAVRKKQARWLALSTLFVLGLWISRTRGAWFASAVGLSLLGLAYLRDSGFRPRQHFKKMELWLLVASALMAGIGWRYGEMLLEVLDRASVMRLKAWDICLKVLTENPYFGAGPGLFGQYHLAYRDSVGEKGAYFSPGLSLHAHNDYLQMGADAGAAMLIAFVALMLFLLWLGLRQISLREQPLAATATCVLGAMLAHAMVHYPFQEPGGALIIWTCAGLICGAASRKNVRHWRALSLSAGGVLMAGAMMVAAPLVVADWYYESGNVSRDAGRKKAESAYRQALSWNPQHARASNNLASLSLQSRDLEAAENFVNRALEIHPQMAEAHFNLGSIHLLRGEKVAALANYKRADALNPHHAATLKNIGRLLESMEKYAEARSYLLRLSRLKPQSAEYRVILGQFLQRRGKLAEARHQYFKATQIELEQYRKAAQKEPGNPSLRRECERLEKQLQEMAKSARREKS